jgi:hypothetical protein
MKRYTPPMMIIRIVKKISHARLSNVISWPPS